MPDMVQEPESIETLVERYEKLKTAKTVAETNRQNAETELKSLKKQAREAYGTDDVQELQEMLQAMLDENLRRRSEYQKSLDGIEHELGEIERKYKAQQEDSA